MMEIGGMLLQSTPTQARKHASLVQAGKHAPCKHVNLCTHAHLQAAFVIRYNRKAVLSAAAALQRGLARAQIHFENFRRTPTANAEDCKRVQGWHQKSLDKVLRQSRF